jgi:hypothetical protein
MSFVVVNSKSVAIAKCIDFAGSFERFAAGFGLHAMRALRTMLQAHGL